MNGDVFSGLNRLDRVLLSSNVCIDKQYGNSTAVAILSRDVDEKCGFVECEEKTENLSNLLRSHNVSMGKLKDINSKLLAENARLQAKLEVAEEKIQETELRIWY